jgi:parvulin-like peptidyl-prolyl isomerase
MSVVSNYSQMIGNRRRLRWAASAAALGLMCVFACLVMAAGGEAAEPKAVEVKAEVGKQTAEGAEKKTAEESLPPLPADVVARANGEDITRKELVQHLLKTYGTQARMFLIRQAILRQAVAKAGITLTPEEVDKTMARFYARLPVPPDTSRADRRKQFLEGLAARGITEEDFIENISLNAMLDKLAEQQVTVADEEVELEFQKRYGPKLNLRQILVAREVAIKKIYDQIKAGADFADLAKEKSTERRSGLQGGKMRRPLPRGVRTDRFAEVAFSLAEGEVSEPFQVAPRGQWCLLKLDSIIPAQKIEFDKVKVPLRDDLAKRKLQSLKPRMIDTIVMKAKIRTGDLLEPQEK